MSELELDVELKELDVETDEGDERKEQGDEDSESEVDETSEVESEVDMNIFLLNCTLLANCLVLVL